jgi:hypothetical protein
MNCHGGCARSAGLKQTIDRVPKLKVTDPKADPRLMGAPGDARQKEMTHGIWTSIPIPTRMTTTTPIRIPTAIPRPRPF